MARKITVEATAYGPPWNAMQGTGITSTGVNLQKGQQKLVVAVDPRVIPYGTKLRIPNNPFGDPNLIFTASDTGGAIKGNRLDFFVASGRKNQNRWGRRNTDVFIVGRGSPKDVAVLGGSRSQNPLRSDPAQSSPRSVERVVSPAVDNSSARNALVSNYLARRKFGQGGPSLAAVKLGLDEAADVPAVTEKVRVPSPSSPSQSPASPSGGGGVMGKPSELKELFWRGQNPVNIDNGRRVGTDFVSGHTGHVHVATGPKRAVAIGRLAQKMGLHVSENPAFDKVDPVHATGSYHYRNQAIDVSGPPAKMAEFARRVARMYRA